MRRYGVKDCKQAFRMRHLSAMLNVEAFSALAYLPPALPGLVLYISRYTRLSFSITSISSLDVTNKIRY